MPVVKIIEPLYGDDRDGNRGYHPVSFIIRSDISGLELDSNNVYKNDYNELCSKDELVEWMGLKPLEVDRAVSCVICGNTENTEKYEYFINEDGEIYCGSCVDKLIEGHRYEITENDVDQNER